jgi:hypothetical protein
VRRRAWRRYRFARALVPVVSAYSDKLYERWRAADMPDGCSWFPVPPLTLDGRGEETTDGAQSE